MREVILDEALLSEIESTRQLMIQSGIENGLQSNKTLLLSKRVDRLMNAFEQHQYVKLSIQLQQRNNVKIL